MMNSRLGPGEKKREAGVKRDLDVEFLLTTVFSVDLTRCLRPELGAVGASFNLM